MEQENMYSWVVLFASFTTLLCGPTIGFASGVIHVALLNEFKEDATLTAWVGSLFSCMFALTGPIASLVINVFDCRTCVVMSGLLMMTGFVTSYLVTDIRLLFLTFALITGLGTGLANTGCIVVLRYYFPKNAAFAATLYISGGALGIFIHPALFQYLTQGYGFHGAFLILGGISLNICVSGMLMRPSKYEQDRQRHDFIGNSLRQKVLTIMCGDFSRFFSIMKKLSFLYFVISVLCFSIAAATEYMFLPEYFIKQGSTFQEGSFAIAVSGLGCIVSRVLTGFASTDKSIGGAILYSSLNGIMAILTLLLPMCSTSSHLRILYGFLLGLYTGGQWVLVNTLTLELLDIQDVATGVGAVMFTCGTGYLIGPPIAAAISDASGYFNSIFLFAVGMLLSACLFGFLSNVTKPTSSATKDRELAIAASADDCCIEESVQGVLILPNNVPE
ncbi:monocarboxylate transporter 12-like [Haliotis rufescens]|uniref:monocarboxylate transporter 12-like n=1 Tax=Haliotis rufescens TaxID=6454 RepID=UPI00201ED763|nr:monocarboxylate transporter 12-like [Haliotis rufescens]